jgi:hypothetical protein
MGEALNGQSGATSRAISRTRPRRDAQGLRSRRDGVIDRRLGEVGPDRVRVHVADNTDDLVPRLARAHGSPDPRHPPYVAAEGVTAREEPLHERAVHDHGCRAVRAIARLELPACQERHTQDVEVFQIA